MQERIDNLLFISSDLNTKIKDLQSENASLITALKLLQTDKEEQSRQRKKIK